MINLFIALIVVLGAGSTVVASDSARPGDFLFPVDRAVEEMRTVFASGEGKAELKVKFAEERLDEIDSILEDEEDESEATTTNQVSEEAKLNLSHALDILTAHLADIHNSSSTTPPGILNAISVIEERLQNRADFLPQELKIRIRDDRGRIELKTEEGKVKVKIDADGEIEVEVENEVEDRDGGRDDNSSERSNSGSGNNATSTRSDDNDDDNSAFEVEADVFTDITVVKVEINDEKSVFTTSAKTRAAIVAEIVSRYPTLVTADVNAVLDFEIENRASRPNDSMDGN